VPRTRPPYPEEFRREAIRLAQLGDKPQRKLARDLDISDVPFVGEQSSRRRRPAGFSDSSRASASRATSAFMADQNSRDPSQISVDYPLLEAGRGDRWPLTERDRFEQMLVRLAAARAARGR
jgi:transposase-like protein